MSEQGLKVFFEPDAIEIFKTAGLKKEDAPEMFHETQAILSSKMAKLSATMGLSYKRLDAYNEQKQTLVDDLIKFKAEGALR